MLRLGLPCVKVIIPVKVICFDTLLQVLILKSLYCTKIGQNGLPLITVGSKGVRSKSPGVGSKKKNGSRAAAL
jgi:hypothetical protein